jgi:hypothetical protein
LARLLGVRNLIVDRKAIRRITKIGGLGLRGRDVHWPPDTAAICKPRKREIGFRNSSRSGRVPAATPKGLFDLIKQDRPDKLVIDVRLNGGGDYEKGLKYLVHPIRDLPEINRKGHLFILVGPNTFSAAMSNSAHFRYQTNAILVGQQIGERPNSYQEVREMKLPNSSWTVRYSVKFYKFVETGENVIQPDQEIIPSWDDYRSGRDPVLEWVLNSGARSGTAKR